MLKNIVNNALVLAKRVNYGVIVKALPVVAVLVTSIGMIKAVRPTHQLLESPIFVVVNNYYIKRGHKHAKINK